MIQKPFAVKDDAVNATIMLYCKAVDEVVKEYEDESGEARSDRCSRSFCTDKSG